MYLFGYVFVVFAIFAIAHMNKYTLTTVIKKHTRGKCIKKTGTPFINIAIISVILSFYSANLGTTGGLFDRYNYIYDFLNRYQRYFYSLDGILDAGHEPGYILLNVIIRKFTDNPYWLFFTVTLIFCIINLYVLSKMSEEYKSVVLLILISLFFFNSTFLFKQALAVSFCNLALLYYTKGDTIRYFVFVMIACTFHATAIIFIPIFFLYKYNSNKSVNFKILIMLFIIFILYERFGKFLTNIPFLNQYLALDRMELSSGAGRLVTILKGIPFYFMTFYSLINKKNIEKEIKNYNFYTLSAILCSMSWIFSYHMYWLFRISWYFMLPTLIFLPKLLNTFKGLKVKIIFTLLVYIPLIYLTFRQVHIVLDK